MIINEGPPLFFFSSSTHRFLFLCFLYLTQKKNTQPRIHPINTVTVSIDTKKNTRERTTKEKEIMFKIVFLSFLRMSTRTNDKKCSSFNIQKISIIEVMFLLLGFFFYSEDNNP
jgi:hypothetical protein